VSEPHITYFNMGPWPIYVGFTQSKKAFAKEMKRLGIAGNPFIANDHSTATMHTLESASDHGLTCIIAMRKMKASPEQVAALIAHEAVHIAQRLWANIGETKPGWEAEAYLVQMIVQCCLQEINKSGLERATSP